VEFPSANFEIAVRAKEGSVEVHDCTFQNGEESSGTTRVRMIADEKSRIYARSKMIANNAGIGHLDCMGLLLADNPTINAIPELINKNKNASLTHDA
jgi:Fe-S cluster assembly scaffold protein SufB